MEVKHLDPNELERWERIDGIIYDMSPAPSSEHQRLSRQLTLAIGSYLKGKTCEPDWVVEILSASTGVKDKTTKLRAYKSAGVREYWIMDPVHRFVEVHDLQNNVFPTVYGKDETVTVGIFNDLEINLQGIFE